jgi:Rad9
MAYTGRIRLSLGRSHQIKDLKVALQCLFKIGSELLVEAIDDKVERQKSVHSCIDARRASLIPSFPQLILRTINTAKSAFFAVTFGASFFDEYTVENSLVVQSAVLLKVGTPTTSHDMLHSPCSTVHAPYLQGSMSSLPITFPAML